MRKMILSVALLVLIGGPEVFAQGSSSVPKNSGPIAAPVGHRQPRASDLPDEHEKNLMNANDAMSKEDAALDKKIKSICRGC